MTKNQHIPHISFTIITTASEIEQQIRWAVSLFQHKHQKQETVSEKATAGRKEEKTKQEKSLTI